MKTITAAQNETKQIERLAAMRQMYADAKRIHVLNMILTVPLSVAVLILAAFLPNLQTFALLWGVIMTILEILLFTRSEESLRLRAAKIQEAFDCEVLQLDWNQVACDSHPTIEEITQYAEKHRRKAGSFEKLKNWYVPPEIDNLPIHFGRIVCQRQNISWEANNRRRYAFAIFVGFALMTAAGLGWGLYKSMSLQTALTAIAAPLLPALVWGINQYRSNRDAAQNMDRLRANIDGLWEEAFHRQKPAEALTTAARDLQDEIFDHRRSVPSVFDFIYWKYRTRDEEQLAKVVQKMIDEVVEKASGKRE